MFIRGNDRLAKALTDPPAARGSSGEHTARDRQDACVPSSCPHCPMTGGTDHRGDILSNVQQHVHVASA